MRLCIFAILVFVISSPVVQADVLTRATPGLVSKGKTVYMQSCVVCHGDKGMGDGPAASTLNPKPRNFISDNFKKGSSPPQIFDTISKGIEGSAMVAFTSLSEQDRWALAFYISSLRQTGKN